MISIVMPAYNAGKYIKDAIESVVRQSYTDWELIIVDDCSGDKTKEIAESCGDERIRVFSNTANMGAAGSRNKGIRLAQGDCIAFLDADDCWDEYKLEKQAALNADFSFTGSGFIDETGEQIDYVLHVPSVVNFEKLLGQNVISNSSVVIKKELIEGYPFPEHVKNIHEDYAVWLSILRTGITAQGIDEPLLKYRVIDSSKSSDKRNAALMNWNVYRYLKLSYPKSIISEVRYAVNGIKKWREIRRRITVKTKN